MQAYNADAARPVRQHCGRTEALNAPPTHHAQPRTSELRSAEAGHTQASLFDGPSTLTFATAPVAIPHLVCHSLHAAAIVGARVSGGGNAKPFGIGRPHSTAGPQRHRRRRSPTRSPSIRSPVLCRGPRNAKHCDGPTDRSSHQEPPLEPHRAATQAVISCNTPPLRGCNAPPLMPQCAAARPSCITPPLKPQHVAARSPGLHRHQVCDLARVARAL